MEKQSGDEAQIFVKDVNGKCISSTPTVLPLIGSYYILRESSVGPCRGFEGENSQ